MSLRLNLIKFGFLLAICCVSFTTTLSFADPVDLCPRIENCIAMRNAIEGAIESGNFNIARDQMDWLLVGLTPAPTTPLLVLPVDAFNVRNNYDGTHTVTMRSRVTPDAIRGRIQVVYRSQYSFPGRTGTPSR